MSLPPVPAGLSPRGLLVLRAARRHEVRALVLLLRAPAGGMLPRLRGDAVRHPADSIRMSDTAHDLDGGPTSGLLTDGALCVLRNT